jgi:hypothetical protein
MLWTGHDNYTCAPAGTIYASSDGSLGKLRSIKKSRMSLKVEGRLVTKVYAKEFNPTQTGVFKVRKKGEASRKTHHGSICSCNTRPSRKVYQI